MCRAAGLNANSSARCRLGLIHMAASCPCAACRALISISVDIYRGGKARFTFTVPVLGDSLPSRLVRIRINYIFIYFARVGLEHMAYRLDKREVSAGVGQSLSSAWPTRPPRLFKALQLLIFKPHYPFLIFILVGTNVLLFKLKSDRSLASRYD